jgi:GH35 family endo-1,4-beta-xylanase
MEIFEHLRKVTGTTVEDTLSVDVVENLVHDHRQTTKSCEGGNAVGGAADMVGLAFRAVRKRCPVLVLLKLVEE